VSCPHAHQQNGAAEQKHRHIVEVGLSLLAQAHMPIKLWNEAFLAATFLINRTPIRVISYKTLEHLYKVQPNYASLQIFGCACWPNLRPYNQRKLQFRSKECVFLGYSNLHKGFKCLDVDTGRIYISSDVTFDEEVFPFSKLHLNAGAKLRSEVHLLPDLFPVQPVRSRHDNVANLHPNDSLANSMSGEIFDVQDQELVDEQEQNQANEQEFPPQPSPPAVSPSDSAPANTTNTMRSAA
jgi:hypothetical protein